MKKLLIDYLLYGVLFGVLTFIAWGRRKYASSLLHIALIIFWVSFILQLSGLTILYFLPPSHTWGMTLLTITIAGMVTSLVMLIHSFWKGKETRK